MLGPGTGSAENGKYLKDSVRHDQQPAGQTQVRHRREEHLAQGPSRHLVPPLTVITARERTQETVHRARRLLESRPARAVPG